MTVDAADLAKFETARLSAERMQADHFDFLHAMQQDPRVMATLGGVRTATQTMEMLDKHLEHWQKHGYGFWIVRDRNSGEFVGRGGLRRVGVEGTLETEVAYALVPERWGRGLATEMAEAFVGIAFKRLNLAQIVAFTGPDNRASRSVMEKVGFIHERSIVHGDLPHVLYRLTRPAACSGAQAQFGWEGR